MSAIDKIKEFVVKEARGLKTIHKEYGDVVDDIQKQLELYKQSKGTPQEKQYVQKLKQLNDKKKALAAELDQKISGIYKDAELKVDEMNTSAAAGPYNTPFAFSGKDSEAKKGKKQADLTGYTVVKEAFIPKIVSYYSNLNEAIITEDTKRANILGIDFNISEANGRIFFSFIDKKAASIKIREIGTNEIVNLIQKSLDDAYGKGEFFFKSGDHAEFQNGYLFQRNTTDIKLNKLKFESVNENRWRDIKNEEAPATTKVNKGIANINNQLAEIEKFLGWYGKLKAENGVNNGNFWKRTNNHIYTIKERLLNLERQVRKISE